MNLTTVQRYKTFMGGNLTGMDTLLEQLIARASDFVVRWSGRSFQRNTYTNRILNGTGTSVLMLPDYPVISVSSVTVNNTLIQASTSPLAFGYQYDDKALYLIGGGNWPMGKRNVIVSWVAGFVGEQTSFIPANPGPYTITPTAAPDGTAFAAEDLGVVYTSSGQALTRVGSSPAAGQYSFSTEGAYTFAAADAGAQVTMNYVYIPGAVEQATLELVGLKVKQRDTLGVRSRSIINESVTYEDKEMTPSIMGLLQPYRRMMPL